MVSALAIAQAGTRTRILGGGTVLANPLEWPPLPWARLGRLVRRLGQALAFAHGGDTPPDRNAEPDFNRTQTEGAPLGDMPDTNAQLDSLIGLARQGDREAFGDLYRMLAPRIHRYVAYRSRDAALADDLTHETFMQAHHALARYEHRSASLFVQWMYGIARRVVAGHYRARRPTEELSESLTLADSGEIERLAGDLAVRDALSGLTAEQRQVIVLRFFYGLSHEEVGAQMGRQAGAIRALQFRALRALREALE